MTYTPFHLLLNFFLYHINLNQQHCLSIYLLANLIYIRTLHGGLGERRSCFADTSRDDTDNMNGPSLSWFPYLARDLGSVLKCSFDIAVSSYIPSVLQESVGTSPSKLSEYSIGVDH